MLDLDPIEDATARFVATGMTVMNAFLLADTEAAHVARLLVLMDPPTGARILDAGCGIGAVSSLMRSSRPDLRFTLLNISQKQLQNCPPDMERLQADFDHIPLPDASVDVVMFNFSICHSADWLATLTEARRVLREGGILFVFDMARKAGNNLLMEQVLQAAAYAPWQVNDVARRAGFAFSESLGHDPVHSRLRDAMPSEYDAIVGDVFPATWRFTRSTITDPLASAFSRHARVGFQFSGGRDSTAALYLLRPYWDRMTVYHLDTGDQFPETREVVARVARDVPITVIESDVAAYRDSAGLASDLVPVDNTPPGRMVSGRTVKLVSRYECCYQNLMRPMQERMVHDGITLLVRGQRDDEYSKPPMRSGDVQAGIEVLYPIQDWSGAQVSRYLQSNDLPLAEFYARGARRAPECMGCTAWWDEGRAGYLKTYHPIHFDAYRQRMAGVRAEIDRQYNMLED